MSKASVASAQAEPRQRGRRPNMVIGLTGPVGSGCSTMAELLAGEFGLKPYKISHEIRYELEPNPSKWKDKKYCRGWREEQQQHGNLRRQETKDSGYRYWLDKVLDRIDGDDVGDNPIVIDGLRNVHAVEAFRQEFHNFFLVAICSESDKRWQRISEKYENNFDQFRRDDLRDKGEDFPWGQSVQKSVGAADYVFSNAEQFMIHVHEETKPDTSKVTIAFKDQVKKFLPLMQGTAQGLAPNPHELQIAAAFAHSDASSCLKRHVGAVITVTVKGRELPIAVGYNENPAGTPCCIDGGGCKKDMHMKSWFDAQEHLCCPRCGERTDKPTLDSRCECGDYLKDWLWPHRGMELCSAIHAEERAVRSLGARSAEEGTLYVTTFPCFQCARMVLDAGITRVVYLEAYPGWESGEFLTENGCDVIPFTGFTTRAFFKVFPRVS